MYQLRDDQTTFQRGNYSSFYCLNLKIDNLPTANQHPECQKQTSGVQHC